MEKIKREITKVYKPPSQPGFLGRGHIARPVIGVDFLDSDPFIMLMDDILEKTDNVPVGGPHPHAGFETVTLLLEGEIGGDDDAMRKGDFEMMTAGSGIVHTETISKPTKMRLLQLWLNLPKKERKAQPRRQRLKAEHAPVYVEDGVRIRVYSGSFANVQSPVQNHTPFVLAEVEMQPNTTTIQKLPANYTTFFYMIDGSVEVGERRTQLNADQVGWLQRFEDTGDSEIKLKSGDAGARLILYSAEPQRHQIVSHGPFIADSMEDIKQLYADFRAGKMEHINEVDAAQQLTY